MPRMQQQKVCRQNVSQYHLHPRQPLVSSTKRITCNQYGSDIPAHLAERWNGISVEDARKAWIEKYRDSGTN